MVNDFWTRIMKEVKDVAASITKMEYELYGNSIMLHDDPLLEKYSEEVQAVLSRRKEPAILRELWRSDELSRPLFSVLWITDPKIDASGQRISIETFKIISEDLLGQRYRGIYHLAGREGLLKEDFYLEYNEIYLDYGKSKIMLDDENFVSKYFVNHLLLRELSKIIKKIKSKYGVEIGVTTCGLLNRGGIKYRDPKEFYATITYDVKSDNEDRVKEVEWRISIIKEFWQEWVEARREIAHSFGMSDEAFMLRDLLEEAFSLPPWTVMVKPATNGWNLIIDLSYASLQREGLDEEQWFNISKLTKVEFRKTDGGSFFKIYSPPIPLGIFLEKIVGPEALGRIMEKLKDQRKEIVTYLFNPANFNELAKYSQLLEGISISLFDLAEFYGLRVSPVQVEWLWPDVHSEPFDIWPVTAEDPHYHSYYKPGGWELIEASLTADIEYSEDIVGLVFKIVETAEKLNEMRNKFEHLLKSMH